MKQYESQFRKLTEVGSVNRGKSKHRPRNAPELYGGPYPFIQTGDVKHANFFITDHTQTYSERGLAQSKLWQPGTLCITIAANIADTAILKIPACFPDSIIGFIPKKGESDVRFTKYCLDTYKKEMQLISQGTTQDNLSQGKLLSLRFRIPEYDQQRQIAAILSAYDELIENNQRRIALLEKMAAEIYREWYVRLRFPGHDKVKLVKGVPQGWRPSCLGNVAKFTMGQSPSSEFYNEVGNGLPFHQGVGTYGERFPRTITYCSEDGRRAHKGDILFSVRAPVGRLNIADREMIIGRGLAALRHKKEFNSYLYYLLKTAFANEDIIGNGSIFNSVGKDELAKFPIFEPEPSLVERFDAIASKMDEQITVLIHAIECLKSSRDLLLPRLISGKLSVENLDIRFPPSMEEDDHA